MTFCPCFSHGRDTSTIKLHMASKRSGGWNWKGCCFLWHYIRARFTGNRKKKMRRLSFTQNLNSEDLILSQRTRKKTQKEKKKAQLHQIISHFLAKSKRKSVYRHRTLLTSHSWSIEFNLELAHPLQSSQFHLFLDSFQQGLGVCFREFLTIHPFFYSSIGGLSLHFWQCA